MVKMDSLAPTRLAAASLDRPRPTHLPARRGLPLPEHPLGVLRGAVVWPRLAPDPSASGPVLFPGRA